MTNEDVGVLAGKCQECVHLNTLDDCEGLTKATFDLTPCSRYKFDSSVMEDGTEEETQDLPVTAQVLGTSPDNAKIVTDVAQSKDVVRVTEQSTNGKESPADKFKRILAKRMKRMEYELKLLAQFGRLHNQYEWTQGQVDDIMATLQKGIDTIKIELTKYAG